MNSMDYWIGAGSLVGVGALVYAVNKRAAIPEPSNLGASRGELLFGQDPYNAFLVINLPLLERSQLIAKVEEMDRDPKYLIPDFSTTDADHNVWSWKYALDGGTFSYTGSGWDYHI
jgi:hypothetical protein